MPKLSNPIGPVTDLKPAIVLHEVSKSFRLKHNQSLKETLIAALKRKPIGTSFNAVDEVSIEVPQGQSVALLGRNGSGKSTTLKLLSGVMRPDEGWIRTRGRVAGLLEVGAGFHPNLTGRENVYLNAAILGMTKEETDAKFDEILEFSEIGDFIDTEVKHYSSGMYSRLGFSVAVHTEVDVLLVDEILSVGDAVFREKCNQRMLELQDRGVTMFVVSHNATQMQQLCERGIVLDHGKMIFDGPIDEAVDFVRPVHPALVNGPREGYPVDPAIAGLQAERPHRYGRAIAEAVTVTENGGGIFQEFENGLISKQHDASAAVAISTGSFLNTYLAIGGPAGPWGFLVDGPYQHQVTGHRSFDFQYGTASFTPEAGVWFDRNH